MSLAVLALPACSALQSPASTAAPSRTTPSRPTPSSPTPSSGATASVTDDDAVGRALRAMTLDQRVGQLFMVGGPATGVGAATRTAVTRYHVGNLMLTGRSTAGVTATTQVVTAVRARATAGVPLLVATDQEGGAVQVLRGEGFSRIPSARTQGRWTPAQLRARSGQWGRQLRAAGVDLNLAPVADTVPSRAAARTNAPVGRFGRELGLRPDDVAEHAIAFTQGMADAGVATTAKHFPGLGRVVGNPDVTSGVTDRTTTREDAYLEPFARAVEAGVPFVMMSTAYYSRIDPGRPAAFSPVVIGELLRGDLGFTGVVISDDLGGARQVAAWSPGQRALRFIGAGGDLVLTVDPTVLPAMYRAVLARARTDAAFRAQVDASARRVLRAKQAQGLLP